MGCTSAKSELSALGLHHHCTRINLDRDLAQLVAHTAGGREVAGSSPVIPTEREKEVVDYQRLPFSLITFLITFRCKMGFGANVICN